MDPSTAPRPPSSPTPSPGSSGRPWIKWVAIGCGGLALLGLLALLAGAGFLSLVMGGLKRSEPFQQAMEAVQASPEAIARLGEPINAGRFVSGSIEVTGARGEASLAIPVRGPEGRGTLYAEATREAGRWSLTTLVLEVRGTGERIDLLEPRWTAKVRLPPSSNLDFSGGSRDRQSKSR